MAAVVSADVKVAAADADIMAASPIPAAVDLLVEAAVAQADVV